MTADDKNERGTDSVGTDQVGKVFIALGRGLRQCLVCEGVFARRAASEHSTVLCMPGDRQETASK